MVAGGCTRLGQLLPLSQRNKQKHSKKHRFLMVFYMNECLGGNLPLSQHTMYPFR